MKGPPLPGHQHEWAAGSLRRIRPLPAPPPQCWCASPGSHGDMLGGATSPPRVSHIPRVPDLSPLGPQELVCVVGCLCGGRAGGEGGRTRLTGWAGPGHFLSLLSLCFFFLLRLNLKTTSQHWQFLESPEEAEPAPRQDDSDSAAQPWGAPGGLGPDPWYQVL